MVFSEVYKIPDWVYAQPGANPPAVAENAEIIGILGGNVKRKYGGVFFEVNYEFSVARLLYIFVKPEKRAQGCATSLLNFALMRLNNLGIDKVSAELPFGRDDLAAVLRSAGMEADEEVRYLIFDKETAVERLKELQVIGGTGEVVISRVEHFERASAERQAHILPLLVDSGLLCFGDTDFTVFREGQGEEFSALCGKIESGMLTVDSVSIDRRNPMTYGQLIFYTVASCAADTEVEHVALQYRDEQQRKCLVDTFGEGIEEQPVVMYKNSQQL